MIKHERGIVIWSALAILILVALLVLVSGLYVHCLLYTSPSPRDATLSRMPSSA